MGRNTLFLEGKKGQSLYETYTEKVYWAEYAEENLVEESLANRTADYETFKLIKRCLYANPGHDNDSVRRNLTKVLRGFMRSQPPAYANFRGVKSNTYGKLLSQLWQSVAEPAAPYLRSETRKAKPLKNNITRARHFPVLDLDAQTQALLVEYKTEKYCPIYRIPVVKLPKKFFANGMPTAPDFREVRDWVERYLAGKLLANTGHDFYEIDNKETIKFPNEHRGNLSMGEFNNLLYKSGMRRPEYSHERQATKFWRRNCPRNPPKSPIKAG